MEKIKDLLAKLGNNVTPAIRREIDNFNKLNEKFNNAKKEYEANPTDESLESLTYAEDFVLDQREKLLEDLEELFEKLKDKLSDKSKEKSLEAVVTEEEESSTGGLILLGILSAVGLGVLYKVFNKQ